MGGLSRKRNGSRGKGYNSPYLIPLLQGCGTFGLSNADGLQLPSALKPAWATVRGDESCSSAKSVGPPVRHPCFTRAPSLLEREKHIAPSLGLVSERGVRRWCMKAGFQEKSEDRILQMSVISRERGLEKQGES